DVEPDAHVVPYHWAPHLLRDWLLGNIRERGLVATTGGALAPRGLPFAGTTSAGDRALSYATWLCPPTCIEPARCPHPRGPKSGSLADDLERDAPGEELTGQVVFRCLHLVY